MLNYIVWEKDRIIAEAGGGVIYGGRDNLKEFYRAGN